MEYYSGKYYAKCSLNFEWTLEEDLSTNEMFLHICKMKHLQADKQVQTPI